MTKRAWIDFPPSHNKWSDTKIFETVASKELIKHYPDNVDEFGDTADSKCNWVLLVFPENEQAVLLAQSAAVEGWVGGVWSTPYGNYIAGLYVPHEAALRLLKETELIDKQEEMTLWAARIIEIGKHPLYTMLGAWNWGCGKIT